MADGWQLSNRTEMPVYIWQEPSDCPKAIVLAIHGLTLHATTYDAWARYLARHKVMVVAPDLRGYGRWCSDRRETTTQYDANEGDLVVLAQTLCERYKGVPLFVAGESLGGSLAIRLAAAHPKLVDGMILSASAIKHKHHLPLKTLASGVMAIADPWHQVDVSR